MKDFFKDYTLEYYTKLSFEGNSIGVYVTPYLTKVKKCIFSKFRTKKIPILSSKISFFISDECIKELQKNFKFLNRKEIQKSFPYWKFNFCKLDAENNKSENIITIDHLKNTNSIGFSLYIGDKNAEEIKNIIKDVLSFIADRFTEWFKEGINNMEILNEKYKENFEKINEVINLFSD